MIRKVALPLVVLFCHAVRAQVTFPQNGAPFNPHSTYAFVNANLYLDGSQLVKGGTLLVLDGKVIDAGAGIRVPPNAVLIDLKGKYIYPSFIDLFSDYGLAQVKTERRQQRGPQPESDQKGAYGWNQAVRAHVEAHKLLVHNSERADELRRNGIGAVLSGPRDGIVRGSGALVCLNASKRETQSILNARAAGFYSFSKGTSMQDYPSSLAGSIALLRQTYYDAQWYAVTGEPGEHNISLAEFNRLKELPAVFEVTDKYSALRAARIGREFNVKYIIRGSGDEYQRMGDIRETGLRFILPLNFPEAFDVEDPYDAENVSLAELKHWELAPANPAFFERNNIPFAFTASGLKDMSSFLRQVRKAIRYGLSEEAALRALTVNPADFINAGDRIGRLKKGYVASFFISSANIFEDDAVILQHWVAGEPSVYEDLYEPDLRGNYLLELAGRTYTVKLSGDGSKPKGQLLADTVKREFTYKFANGLFSFVFSEDSARTYRGSGAYHPEAREFSGNCQQPDGAWTPFSMQYRSAADSVKKATPAKPPLNLGKVIYPFTAYGEPLPEEQGLFRDAWNKFRGRYGAVLIRDATVWTNEEAGVLKDHDVYIVDGKIVRIAPDIDAPKLAFAKVIDGKGMHLTPGIIDEHSHIALSAGVNEGAQASSAEVRMGDVINPEDINIYRQLSGGVTTSQLLHGSANPIGGQSALIKLRWGHGAEELKFAQAPQFIKFALGENVKQSNWGERFTVRFPQSRMGVEQVFADHFIRAREYELVKRNAANAKGKDKAAFRRDLELDAIAEILAGKRFITCHSYVQSEINMLMHLADSLGFKVNTFTHILEGYKVADKMKAHGANASTFSDWWAYKNEVMEAIPHNAALLAKVGVNTAVNSDDAEMARRLNQEAAKAVKYGGLSEEEALKLVTLNPARMLHIDDKVGSIKPGKSADLVLWSDHPLSVYARAEKTIIDGNIYFDRQEDARLREELRAERARLIAKLISEKRKGEKVVKPQPKQPKLYHCNTLEGVDESITGPR